MIDIKRFNIVTCNNKEAKTKIIKVTTPDRLVYVGKGSNPNPLNVES